MAKTTERDCTKKSDKKPGYCWLDLASECVKETVRVVESEKPVIFQMQHKHGLAFQYPIHCCSSGIRTEFWICSVWQVRGQEKALLG